MKTTTDEEKLIELIEAHEVIKKKIHAMGSKP